MTDYVYFAVERYDKDGKHLSTDYISFHLGEPYTTKQVEIEHYEGKTIIRRTKEQ